MQTRKFAQGAVRAKTARKSRPPTRPCSFPTIHGESAGAEFRRGLLHIRRFSALQGELQTADCEVVDA